MPVRPARSDDPTGGRRLTRRLMRVLPACLVAGLVIGVPLAILAGDWRPAVAIPFALAALGGTIAAAVEDGRVQRDVDADRHGGPPSR
jgi:peptidoglycan/LPS O-acetylase OafA/YrhL